MLICLYIGGKLIDDIVAVLCGFTGLSFGSTIEMYYYFVNWLSFVFWGEKLSVAPYVQWLCCGGN